MSSAAQQFLDPIVERLQQSASVKSVYGDPIESTDHTVVPVARIAYGFGSGGGENGEDKESGFGAGGGLAAKPVGALEITDGGTRFVRFDEPRRTLVAFVVGLLVGLRFGRRKR